MSVSDRNPHEQVAREHIDAQIAATFEYEALIDELHAEDIARLEKRLADETRLDELS